MIDEEWRQVVEQLVGSIHGEDFLDQHLEHVGEHLEDTPRTYTHRAQTALEVGTHLTLHKDKYDGYQGVSCQNADTDEHALYQNRQEVTQAQCLAKEIVDECCYYTEIKHFLCY